MTRPLSWLTTTRSAGMVLQAILGSVSFGALPAQTTVAPPAALPAAKALVHQVWGMEDGLPLSHVNAVLPSRSGYLWLATYDGLVRFDGVRFTLYNASNHPELPTSRFTSLYQDDAGALWVTAAFDHVVRFADGRFDVFSLPNDQRGRPIRSLQIDAQGTVWVTTTRGLYRVAPDGLQMVPGTSAAEGGLHLAEDGSVWLATASGALQWRGGMVSEFYTGRVESHPGVTSFASAPNGAMYLGTPRGLFIVRAGALRPVRFPSGAP